MPSEDADPSDNQIIEHDNITLLRGLGESSGDLVECMSITLNSDDVDNADIREVIVNDKLVRTTLTAITLPDGTQAFVTNKLDGEDLSDGKTLRFELEPTTYLQSMTEGSTSDHTENTYVQLIDGTTYMLTGHVAVEDDLSVIQGEKLKKDKSRNQHPCSQEGCTKVYSTPHHLKVHERSHTGQRPYRCTHAKCKKSFSTGYSLKAHFRTHTGEKPYKCTDETCGKGFKTSGDLLKHVRTHTGERPFPCPFEGCERSFTTSNIRKVHLRTHTGERPYKCDQCSKAFASATNYKNHIRIHSGEKPYVCTVENCDRRFTEYSSLYKHQLVHTQQKPFECKFCHRRYRQSSTLAMHKRTAHALIESDDGIDVFLTDASDEPTLIGRQKSLSRTNRITVNKDGQVRISEATEDSSDTETQILLVGHPSQIAAIEHINLDGEFEDSPIDASLESLNIKIEGMEFGWT